MPPSPHKHAPAVALADQQPRRLAGAVGADRRPDPRAGRARRSKPVLAFVEDVAASGGYWLACAADEIFADPSSIVGSIGVVSAGFGFQEAIARLGIERRVHTTGERKALLDPFRPERPDDLELLREHPGRHPGAASSRMCASRRGDRLKGGDAELFDGRVWTGDAALRPRA